MKYLEFGTEHPELMVILHGGGICYRAADIVHSDVLGEYIRDGAALGTFDFDALAPDIAHGTVGDDHLRNLPYRLQPDADARADRGERTVGDMHILRERPPDSYKALAAQVAAIGNNLNQLTRLANSTSKIENAQLAEANRLMQRIWQLMREEQ